MHVKVLAMPSEGASKPFFRTIGTFQKRVDAEGKSNILHAFKIPQCLQEKRPQKRFEHSERHHKTGSSLRAVLCVRHGAQRPSGSSDKKSASVTPMPATGSRIMAIVKP